MKIGHKIDSNGFLVEDILDESGITPDVTVICPDGFYKPKWSGTAWVEGLTQEEIDAIRNAPKPKTELELLREENDALKQRSTQNSADLQGFMDYYFSINPE